MRTTLEKGKQHRLTIPFGKGKQPGPLLPSLFRTCTRPAQAFLMKAGSCHSPASSSPIQALTRKHSIAEEKPLRLEGTRIIALSENKTERKRSVDPADKRATGGASAQRTNSEFSAGSIHHYLDIWLALEPNVLVSTTIREGYSIPFESLPAKPRFCQNRRSALEHEDFVTAEISELLATGAVQRVNHALLDLLHVHPFSVATGKKTRLVLDLSHLNSYVCVPRFKFEDVGKLVHVFSAGGFMATFDFKSGYHHVKVNPEHTKYLGFKWKDQFYQFLCLPFGLSSAPHIFTKILRPFIKKVEI